MCYAYGSIDQATKVCPMCKVFVPSGARCPHIRDVCRNKTCHPRHDVVYLKNAEVQSFNGCGFCKWARMDPPPKFAGLKNPGWPGCCRAPSISEQRLIPPADWPSVSIVHHVPIPTDVKILLDSLSPRRSPIPSVPSSSVRQPSMPPLDRKGSGNSSPSSKANLSLAKTPSVAIPAKGRSGGSPQQITSSLAGLIVRSPEGSGPSSVPNSSSMDCYQTQRRQIHPEYLEKRGEPHSSHSSPGRKYADLEATLSRRNSSSRPAIPPATSSMSVTKVTVDAQPQRIFGRRASVSGSNPLPRKPSPPIARSVERPDRSAPSSARTQSRKGSVELSSASSSSGSSDGLGSLTESTVTSDGGFTDYLSDESEAELQRQAEAKAALVAQTHAEEQEFKAARQQLAHVDLRPPKSWNALSNVSGASSLASYASSFAESAIVELGHLRD